MYPRELIKLLTKNGWQTISQNGSHVKLKNGNQTEIIPLHNKDLKKGLLTKIMKRTGLK